MNIGTVLFGGVMVALSGGFVVWGIGSLIANDREVESERKRKQSRIEALLGDGSRVTLSVGCSGRYPYRVEVEGRVFAFADSARLGLWLDHLDNFLDWSSTESERVKHSPTALGYGVNAAHPAISL